MRILLVEDEVKMANFVQRGLKEESYSVDVAQDGNHGLELAELNSYDLIMLDVMLPGKDGLTICRELRKKKIDTPILMLTARDDVKDTVKGLDSGADDYLTKPFAFEELLARTRALLRKHRVDKTTLLRVADLEIDQLAHKVKRAGKEIQLMNKEYALLEYLMLNVDKLVTRTMISEHVWDEHFDSFTNVIDVCIHRLRVKIDQGQKKQLIQSIRGSGYMLKK